MNSTDMSLDAVDAGETVGRTSRRPGPAAFIALALLALAICAVSLYMGRAPLLSPYPEDWIGWARTTLTWSGVFAVGIVLLAVGLIGAARTLLPAGHRRAPAAPQAVMAETSPLLHDAAVSSDADMAVAAAPGEPRPPRGALKFDADRIASLAPDTLTSANLEPTSPEPADLALESTEAVLMPPSPSLGVDSLEPAIFHDPIFHDNASDSFMSRPQFTDSMARDTATPTAQIIPIRPDISQADAAGPERDPETRTDKTHDPLEAALLADAPDPVVHVPAGDMMAVINSTLRFAPQAAEDSAPVSAAMPVETPEMELEAEKEPVLPVASATVAPSQPDTSVAEPSLAETPETAAEPAGIDDEAAIRQAVQTALSVWPDSTRAIAADELSVRIAHLYYDPSPQSAQAFQSIAGGDLSGASNRLQSHAASLAAVGLTAQAAELWRIVGALHMGRDDARAMTAYEHVSALDPSDANIHLYLARRYQLAGDTAKHPVAIARALNVISDPVTRAELLAPYADLMLKSGDVKAGGDALEELSRLHETTAYLRPDDVAARSAHAIAVARLAQTREMQGAFDQAGPLYKKAHQVFADLSAMKPEHPGLRAMAENALRDARRFNTAG